MGAHRQVQRAVGSFTRHSAAPAPKVIQPRQHFGRDESFQLFIQEVDGQDILDTTINSLPARILRCFKTMMRRMHAHHREQDNHRFFVPYTIAVRNHWRPADPKANITFRLVNHNGTVLGLPGYAYVPGLATGTEVTLVALDPNKLTVVMACSESHNCFTALAQRWHVQVVTITLQDDLLSQYGENLAKHASTKSSDMLFCWTLHGRIIMGEIEHNTRTNNKQTHPKQTA